MSIKNHETIKSIQNCKNTVGRINKYHTVQKKINEVNDGTEEMIRNQHEDTMR